MLSYTRVQGVRMVEICWRANCMGLIRRWVAKEDKKSLIISDENLNDNIFY